jgi:hypothetical protein
MYETDAKVTEFLKLNYMLCLTDGYGFVLKKGSLASRSLLASTCLSLFLDIAIALTLKS